MVSPELEDHEPSENFVLSNQYFDLGKWLFAEGRCHD